MAYQILLGVDGAHGFQQMSRDALGKLRDGIDTRGFQQLGIFLADPMDAVQIRMIDPAQ